MFGGINIVGCGDFHQFPPMSGTPVYKANWSEHWHGSVNACIFLQNDHRFEDDPTYGQILGRIRKGEQTMDDIHKINTRWLGNDDVSLPSDGNICYACPINKDHNAISTQVFSDLIEKTHPSADKNPTSVPNHSIVIECSIRKKKIRVSENFHNTVFAHCGDNDVRTGNKKIDPALKFYSGIPLMINTNDELDKGRANGTLCRGIGVKLKSDSQTRMKTWDGKVVPTVSVDDVEYMLCEHYGDSLTPYAKFKLYPDKDSVKINLKIFGQIVSVGGVNVTQFPVNSNIATTGHKLQGMTKDSLIVFSWNYTFANWIYVVLSRVRTLQGLFLCQKLNEDQQFSCDEDLFREEERLAQLEITLSQQINFVHWKNTYHNNT